MQSYIVVVRVMKIGDSEINYRPEFSTNLSNEYKDFAKMSKEQIDKAYMSTDIKDNYIGSNVMAVNKVNDGGDGVLVNFTVHLTQRDDLDENLLREELVKIFGNNAESLPDPQSISADVEDVADFDECKSEQFNDCAASAICINEPGSYRCECKNGYPDLDPSFPGRVCAAEIKACDYCYGRGDCIRDDLGQVTTCKCHRMYLGRKCEINGLRKKQTNRYLVILVNFILNFSFSNFITDCSNPLYHFNLLYRLLLSSMEKAHNFKGI